MPEALSLVQEIDSRSTLFEKLPPDLRLRAQADIAWRVSWRWTRRWGADEQPVIGRVDLRPGPDRWSERPGAPGDYYLDEFTFRFNRRKSASRGKLLYRLAQQAVPVEPVPFAALPQPQPLGGGGAN